MDECEGQMHWRPVSEVISVLSVFEDISFVKILNKNNKKNPFSM